MRIKKTKVSMIVVLVLAGIWSGCDGTSTPRRVNAVDSEKSAAKPEAKAQTDDLRAGKNFMATKVYGQEEDQKILKLFEGLRVADVTDGMDKAGLPNIGLMSPEIRPLWKDTEHYAHRFIGIAVTARYVPANKPPAPAMRPRRLTAG
jgi:hypothetical protein